MFSVIIRKNNSNSQVKISCLLGNQTILSNWGWRSTLQPDESIIVLRFYISGNGSENVSRSLNSKILSLFLMTYPYVGDQCYGRHLINQIQHYYQPLNTNLSDNSVFGR